MTKKINPKIASLSGPEGVVHFKKNEMVKLKFTINLVNVDPKQKYSIYYLIKNGSRILYQSAVPPFGKERMENTSSGYLSTFDILLNTDQLHSGQYEYKFVLLSVLEMNKDGKAGAGIVMDSKKSIFVAEEKIV